MDILATYAGKFEILAVGFAEFLTLHVRDESTNVIALFISKR